MSEENKNIELKDEELKNASGGTSHSSDTYDELGIDYDRRYQVGSNHPVITTIGNSCDYTPNSCKNCSAYHSFTLFSGYCAVRSKENDIGK